MGARRLPPQNLAAVERWANSSLRRSGCTGAFKAGDGQPGNAACLSPGFPEPGRVDPDKERQAVTTVQQDGD